MTSVLRAKLKRFAKLVIGTLAPNLRFAFATPLAYRPGHFYSPICDPMELKRRYRDPAASPVPHKLPGIDLAEQSQIEIWERWRPFFAEARSFAIDDVNRRYRLPSANYDVGDAIVYVCMLRYLQPQRLIEIGAGSSSAVALDACDRFLDKRPHISFIDPYPALLNSLLAPRDKEQIDVVASCIQDVPVAYFAELQDRDILFIDSTHIIKTGSDVVYELFEIMPTLRSGVVVHFHDAFYPFEYPAQWVLKKNYSWNELYGLRAFLTSNRDWEILFFNDYFARMQRELVARDAPEILRNPGGGLWLRRR